jgi:hypothetical protein
MPHTIPQFPRIVLYAGLAMVVLSGCGNNERTVRGRVTYDGKPVEQGIIVFEPPAGAGQTAAGEIKDGCYEFKSAAVVAGSNLIRIRGFRKTGKQVSAMPASRGMVDEIVQFIPAQFNDRSTLTADVEAGKEVEVNFDLKKP